jgi:pyruvate kinase
MPTFTKIIATIGPASQDPDTLRKLQQAGMNAARINLSHGDRQSQADYIHRLRQLDNNLAIILDTKGPEIRTGRMAADPTGFTSGQTVVLTGSAIEGTGDTIPIVYPHVDLAVKAILTPTESGFTARNVSRFRPKCPIFASTKDHMVLQHLQLVWGGASTV